MRNVATEGVNERLGRERSGGAERESGGAERESGGNGKAEFSSFTLQTSSFSNSLPICNERDLETIALFFSLEYSTSIRQIG